MCNVTGAAAAPLLKPSVIVDGDLDFGFQATAGLAA